MMMMMMMNFATNLLGFSREQYVAGSILFVSYESSLLYAPSLRVSRVIDVIK